MREGDLVSRYTTEIRYICESLSGLDKSTGYSDVNEVIEKSRSKIFPAFEIFDESYRPILETKILKHFYTREIGFETFGLWKLRLDAKLSLIMPYYNKLYESINIDIPVIENVDMNVQRNIGRNDDTKVNDKTDIGSKSTTTTDTTSNSKIRHSDTPQGSLQDLESNEYLSDATLSDTTQSVKNETNTSSNSKSESATNAKSTEDYAERRWGKEGSATYISMVNEYIEKMKNIDAMLIHELDDLFMQIWDLWE